MKSAALILILVSFSACHNRLQFIKVRSSKEQNQSVQACANFDTSTASKDEGINMTLPKVERVKPNRNNSFTDKQFPLEENDSFTLPCILESEDFVQVDTLLSPKQLSPSNVSEKKIKANRIWIDLVELALWICMISFCVGWLSLFVVLILAFFEILPWVWMFLPAIFATIVIISGVVYFSQTGPN